MGYIMMVMALIFLLVFGTKFTDSKMLTGTPTFERSHNSNQQRLPPTMIPTHYRIKLLVPLVGNNFSISGEEWISLNCSISTTEVVFNAKNIDINGMMTTLYDTNDNSFVLITDQRYENSKEMYVLNTATPLISGKQYEMYLQFSYQLNDELVGFYRSSYIDKETGEKHWIATTQFSPTSARRAFPCWDEPAFKARFTIVIGHPRQYHVLSNMPVKISAPIQGMDNWKLDTYQTTLPMSTYLVAFIVSDFVPYKTVIDNNSGWKFTLWSRKDVVSQTQYASKVGPQLLNYLEDYFGTKFPLPKQDVVAIPDFGFSAMENWGLITFRESSLLLSAPGETELNIAYILGHELAHQWFGNLVTPAWWSDLWLKEGFATFIGYKAVDHVESSWKMQDQFLLSQILGSMAVDSLNSTHQIEVDVEDPKDIVQIFDHISYEKGASIINMMSNFLGQDSFRAGLKRYLDKHKYSNACQDQLWLSFTEEASSLLPEGVTIKDIMDTWTLQPGFPVVTVNRNYNNATANIEQERYFLLENYTSSAEKWWVPISYTTQSSKDFNNTQAKIWLDPQKPHQTIYHISATDWLLINLKHTGYYKVNYDEENWCKLQNAYLQLPETVRAQLLSDSFSLAATGRTNYSIALGFSTYLPKDNSYFSWSIAVKRLSFIWRLLIDKPANQDLKAYLLHLVVNAGKELTFFPKTSTDNHLDSLLRIKLVSFAAQCDYPQLVNEGRQLLSGEIEGRRKHIMADFKMEAYCAAIKHGGIKEWQFIWKKYLKTDVASDQIIYLKALGCSRNSTTISRYLNWILDPGCGIRKQDGVMVFNAVAERNPNLAFNFLKEHWDDLQSYFGLGFRYISKMIETLGMHLSMEHQLIEIQKLRSDHIDSLGSTSNSFKQTIERVAFNIQWMKNHYESVRLWLKQKLEKLKKS